MDPTLDPYTARLFQIESGGDPNAQTGSNRGLAQFGPQEELNYGINNQNRTDPAAQAAAVQREAQAHTPILTNALGRAPSPGELYLTHQQGVAGGPALLTGGDTPAWQAVRPYYHSDAIAKEAITGNPFTKGMDPNISARDFSNGWINKFEGSLSSTPQPTGGSMPDPTQGALSPPAMNPDAALYGSTGWAGSGGIGNTLQNVGGWLMARDNPAGGAALIAQSNAQRQRQEQMALQLRLGMKPEFLNGGTDPLTGQVNWQYGNPADGTIRAAGALNQLNGGGGSNPSGLSNNSVASFRDAMNKGVSGEDLLNYVPNDYKGYLQALHDGRAIPGNLGRAGAARTALVTMAQDIWGPDMDETNIAARQAAAKSMGGSTNSTLGGQIASGNTVMEHLGHVADDIDTMDQLGITGRFKGFNWFTQNVKSLGGDEKTQAVLSAYQKHLQAAAGELVNLTRGTNGSLQEVQDWKNGMNSYDTTASLRAGTNAAIDLMHGRLNSKIDQYNQVMHKDAAPDSYLTPQSQKNIARITGQSQQYAPDAPPPQQTAPGPAPSPAAPAAPAAGPPTQAGVQPTAAVFKGRTATGPHGERMKEIAPNNWIPM